MKTEKVYTSQEAAAAVGVSDSRIRQLALAGEIEHRYFGRSLVITEAGIKQALARKKTRGPKAAKQTGRKVA
ncbi:MAG: helix-turn-helix domain-containing protein [Actinomycetota bacterium]